MKQLFYFILSTTLISSSCNKEKQSQNYFKCKVDGQEYVPDNCANCVSKTILGDTVLLLGGNTGFKAIAIGINDNSGIKATQYLLNDVIGRRGTY